MNFTDYEWLRKRNRQLAKCLDDCLEAERSARLRPMHTLVVTRRALENLFMEQCRLYRLEFTDLSYAINDVCRCLRTKWREIKDRAHDIRVQGNDDVHPEQDSDRKVHATTQERIDQAMTVLQEMYEILSMLYGQPRGKAFSQERIPFDDYEIIRQISDPTNPGLKRYFVRGSNGRTCFLQCLSHRELAELEKRRQDANKLVYENRRRNDNRLLLPINLPLPYESDLKLLIYGAYPQSFLLSELKTQMTLKEALSVGLNLIEALEKLKKLGMYHRSIYPGCIMVESGENGGYEAYLMDLQTSKITSSNVTVNAKLVSAYDSSQYVPSILWGKALENIDWEKVDVYAVCKVVLFCLDNSLVQINNTSRFREYPQLAQSGTLRNLYARIFQPGPDLRNIPTLEKLKEAFLHESNNC